MKVSIITCMLAFPLTMGAPIRRRASQTEKTVPIGGNVSLLCPFIPDDLWKWVYWMKDNHTIYSLEYKSNTTTTNDTRYEGSNHATRLMIKDLKKTDSGIYHCKVVTLLSDEERGKVLLSVTDQEPVELSTTSPSVPFRPSTTIPPQPAAYNKIYLAFSIFIFIIVIINIFVCLGLKYWERIKAFRFVGDCRRLLAPRRTDTQLVSASPNHENTEEGPRTNLLSSNTHGRDDVGGRPEENSNASKALTSETRETQLQLVEPLPIDDLSKVSTSKHPVVERRREVFQSLVELFVEGEDAPLKDGKYSESFKKFWEYDQGDQESAVKRKHESMTRTLVDKMRSTVRELEKIDAALCYSSRFLLCTLAGKSGSASLSQQSASRSNQPASETEQIDTLDIDSADLNERPSASRDLAQFICKMPHLKNLLLRGGFHHDFYSELSAQTSSAKIDTLDIDSGDLNERPSASSELTQFISKMPLVKYLTLRFPHHGGFFLTSSSITPSAKIDTLDIDSGDLDERPSGSLELTHDLCILPHFEDMTPGDQNHDPFSTLARMASSTMSGNTIPNLTELTLDDNALRGWQDCGSMFDNVKRLTLQFQRMINCALMKIYLPGVTEFTIQTHNNAGRPARFYDNLEPTTLSNALLKVSPQLDKVTFSDLDIGNSQMEAILQALRSPPNLNPLKAIRFIRCGTVLSMDDDTVACNKDQVMEVEVVHGKPRGDYFIE